MPVGASLPAPSPSLVGTGVMNVGELTATGGRPGRKVSASSRPVAEEGRTQPDLANGAAVGCWSGWRGLYRLIGDDSRAPAPLAWRITERYAFCRSGWREARTVSRCSTSKTFGGCPAAAATESLRCRPDR